MTWSVEEPQRGKFTDKPGEYEAPGEDDDVVAREGPVVTIKATRNKAPTVSALKTIRLKK